MTKTINKFFALFIFSMLALGVFTYFVQPNPILQTAHAAFGGESGNGGCCGGGNQGGGDNGGNQGGGDNDQLPPVCNYLKADKTSLPVGGGTVNLSWSTSRGVSAALTPTGAAVAVNGSKAVAVTTDTNFVLRVTNRSGSAQCQLPITVAKELPAPTCDSFKATPSTLGIGGGEVTLTWATSNANDVSIDQGVGPVSADGSKKVSTTETKTYTLTAKNGEKQTQCPVTVTVEKEVKVPKCEINANPTVIKKGQSSTLTWTSSQVFAATIDKGVGAVNPNGSTVVSPLETTTYTFTGKFGGEDYITCPVTIKVEEVIAPTCEIHANPTTIKKGQSATLTWSSSRVVSASIDQGIGVVNTSGSKIVSPVATTIYTFTGQVEGKDPIHCPVTVTVSEDPQPEAPTCDSFTATPNSFNNGVGGGVTLTWATTNADTVTIDHGVGAVAVDGSTGTSVTDDTTFTLTAVKGEKSVSCPVTVTVTEPTAPTLSCDSFTASPATLPVGGGDTVLTWATTDATDVSINNGVGTVSVDGSKTINVTANTTFTLTLRDDKGNTKTCDASVSVTTSSGGGGGSSAPSCKLTISDDKIKSGQEVTLSWKNTRTNDMILEDNRGNILVDTSKTKNYDEDEDSIKVKPTRDTEYTMTVSRGSRDRVCRVQVEMEDDVTVISTRTQTPQVAGISLTQVPYTGFEAGPFLTLLFYSLLAVWAAFIAYMIVIKEQTVAGVSLNGNKALAGATHDAWEDIVDQMHENLEQDIDTGVVATTATAPYISPVKNTDGTPANLPTGEAPIMGYKSLVENIAPVAEEVVDEMTDLENAAHLKQALLSSDAINYFMDNYSDEGARFEALTNTIEKAKGEFPSEGGWMVLNLERVQELNKVDATAEAIRFVPETRVGVSSLAEAIVSGNVAAAYEMIDGRPMFALADAAADLDAVYRARKGMNAEVSSLLATSTAKLSDSQIESIIKALTSALDGAYSEEAAAVKMAIMKAVKIAG